MVKLTDLRPGDKILVEVTVTDRRLPEGATVCVLPSQNEMRVFNDSDVKDVVFQTFKVGDRVTWYEQSEQRWEYGTIIALSKEIYADRTWAWIEQDTKWLRKTLNTKELARSGTKV